MASGETILLTGATGFVGSKLLERLLADGERVRCLVLPDDPTPLPRHPACEIVTGDLTRPETLPECGEGVRAIVHSAALMLPNPPEAIRRVNVAGTESLVALARRAGIRRFVYLSAVSAVYRDKNSYGLSKLAAEEHIAAAGLDFTILRPTMVYGRGGGLHFQKLVSTMRGIPGVFPVMGSGRARLQPVWIDDVVEAIVRTLVTPATIGKRYGVSGATVVPYNELVDRIAAELGLRRRRVHLPLPLALLAARAAVAVSPKSFLSPEALSGVNQDADLDHSELAADCGFAPIGLDEGLRRALGDARS